MRRISPTTLRQRVMPPIRITPLVTMSTRSLKTTSRVAMPRTSSTRRTFVAPAASVLDSTSSFEHPSEPIDPESNLPDEGETPGAGPSRSPPDDLSTRAFELIRPESSSTPISTELRPALTHLSTTFLPGNQHLAEDSSPSSPFTHVITFADGRPRTEMAGEDEGPNSLENSRQEENVIALATPFEGGDGYVTTAAHRLASELDADVVRIDLALALGLDGVASPLGRIDLGPPELPSSINPLYRSAPAPVPPPRRNPLEPEEMDEGSDMPGMAFTSMPIAVVSGGGGGMPSLGGMSPPGDHGAGQINEDWVGFFAKLINVDSSEPGRKRIVLLESTIAMSRTFPIWWPSFVEAVRRRRTGTFDSRRSRKQPRAAKVSSVAPVLRYPTSIVFSCAPSLLLSHTAPSFQPSLKGEPEHSEHNEEEHGDDSHADPAQALVAALEEKFKSMGVHVQHHVEVVKSRSHAKLWWGSEERDASGRAEGDQTRLDVMLKKGVDGTLPTFGQQSPSGPAQPASNPLQRLLMNRLRPQSRSEEAEDTVSSLVWKAFAVTPQHRNTQVENDSRIVRRRIISAALISRAVSQLGGTLVDPLDILQMSESTGKQLTRKTKSSSMSNDWGNAVASWQEALHIASIAVGTVTRNDSATVHWQDIVRARKAAAEERKALSDQLKRHIHTPPKLEPKSGSPTKDGAPVNLSDPVVEKLKKAKNLSQHEKRLLPCIVDPSKLASTSFKDVHLPDKTIDAIRSMVSLPLLFPEAFRGGVLKDHATSGALLFGPPGTGKTLMARAIASESGARMLAIQPSDVNDMYIGEGEKLVKAVFSLARRLSPCVVFLDEVDALFGARISRGSAGSMSHNLLLTEFMQEMDGLSSAIANKDKRVVVIGATNRPFDLDDAVLRRLPRRLLVDLPSVEGRKAILEILLRGEKLGDDIDLDKLAKETDGFSGSDLKHLCVSAALSAVKDTVHVPWAKDISASTSSLSSASSAPLPSASSRPGGGGMQELLVVTPTDGGAKGRRKHKVVKHKAEAAPIAGPSLIRSSSSLPEAEAGVEDGVSDVSDGTVGEGEAERFASRQPTENEEQTELLSANKEPSTPRSEAETTPSEETGPSIQVPPKPRILLNKHFKIALEEIRPSASEEGSLPELRKWAEQFGEGGTRKGKKSGFGKGFGFGEVPVRDQESGYGRVKSDDQ